MWRPPTPYSHLRTGSPVKSAIALLRPPGQRKSLIESVIRLERTSEFSLLPERINFPREQEHQTHRESYQHRRACGATWVVSSISYVPYSSNYDRSR
jgi:hypothetical protein